MVEPMTKNPEASKQRLFDIVRAIQTNIDENEGVVTDELNALDLDLETKVQAYHHVYLERCEKAAAKKKSAAYFSNGAAIEQRAAEAIEARLLAALQELGRDRVETPTCTASVLPAEHVEIKDTAHFLLTAEDRFIKPGEPSIKKAEIAKALKAGETVEGAAMVETKYLRLR